MKILSSPFLLILLISLFCRTAASAQDTLKFLNGRTIVVEIKDIGENEIEYTEKYKGRTTFQKRELNTIFSYHKKNKKKVMVYEFNPEIGNIYKVEEMEDYILGENHADEYYHSRVYNIIGLASGAVAGYLLADEGSPVLIAAPLIYSSLIIIPSTRVKKNPKNIDLRGNSAYRDGYRRVAKGKKFFGALKFSALGMLASFAITEITE